MTTKLFATLDLMAAACLTVPALAGRVGVERTLPYETSALPVVTLHPRRSQPSGMGGEVQGRDTTVVVIVRCAGDQPGRAAHELLALAHAAMTTAPALNDGSVQLDPATETFRYVDSEQSTCDLQVEYEITFELARESLLGF